MEVTLIDILDAIDERGAWGWMLRRYRGGRASCPKCDADLGPVSLGKLLHYEDRIYCKSCESIFPPSAGTPIYQTCWTPVDYVKLVGMHLVELPASAIAARIGRSESSVRDMLDRVRLLETTPLPRSGIEG